MIIVAAGVIAAAMLISGCSLIGGAGVAPDVGAPIVEASGGDSYGADSTPSLDAAAGSPGSGCAGADAGIGGNGDGGIDGDGGIASGIGNDAEGGNASGIGSGGDGGAGDGAAGGGFGAGFGADFGAGFGVGESEAAEPEPPSTIVTLTISAAGDVTLGGDPRYSNSFVREFNKHEQDHSVFLRNVKHIFDDDDLTIVNLEGPLTDATPHLDKGYVFRGPPHFAKILSSSGVDAVTLANNHIKDFLAQGYQDTIEALEAEGISYFGNEFSTIMEIKGIKVGLFGLLVWYDGKDNRDRITAAIKDLQTKGAQLVVAYYHWGDELARTPGAYQKAIGRFTIDSGADLVLGAHAHVIQGIEEYKGKNIVYSLANFCFGGNNNPRDKDTFIFQQTFTFDDGELLSTNETNIIPVRSSSNSGWNDFTPIVAQGDEAERILQRIQEYSDQLNQR